VNRHHRTPAQTLVIAVVAMTSMLGAVSMIVDAGVYFVLQHQLQNAADAAALAAVWYSPACVAGWSSPGTSSEPPTACQTTAPPNAAAQGCPPPGYSSDLGPCAAAKNQVALNLSVAESLCAGPISPSNPAAIQMDVHPGTTLVVPNVGTYVVSLSCDAPHWFARVLPDVCKLPACAVHISVNAAAALGWAGPDGAIHDTQPQPPTPPQLVARLIL
jgi:hypothetical protein